MGLEYDILKRQKDVDVLWSGTVKMSQSFVDCMSEPIIQDDLKIYTISDHRFGREDNAQFDNPGLSKNFPNEIAIVLKGNKIMEFMRCSVFTRQEYLEAGGGFMQKSVKRKKTMIKGFFLEPSTHAGVPEHAYLSVFQFDNRNSDNQIAIQFDSVESKPSLVVEKLGCAALASGSQGSNITFSKDPQKSVTIFYVATDQKPFIARLDTNQGKRRTVCRSDGVKTEEIKPPDITQNLRAEKYQSVHSSALDEPLKILNTRLAKGEITIYEYENLRKVMESKAGQASTNWWV